MNASFYGYYPPTTEEYHQLWQKGIIVFDTNILLDLYRLPKKERDEFLSLLEELNDRLWIPYQVALEYQRRRIGVILEERNAIRKILGSVKEVISGIKGSVKKLDIDKRVPGVNSAELISNIESANSELVQAIEKACDAHEGIFSSDEVRSKLDQLFNGRVGQPPANQKEMDLLVKDGEDRYKKSFLPGIAMLQKATIQIKAHSPSTKSNIPENSEI